MRLPAKFQIDPSTIESRLRQRPTRLEFAALTFAMMFTGMLIYLRSGALSDPYDFSIFLGTADGEFADFYYGYWIVPVFEVLALLPMAVSFALWSLVNLMGVYLAARVFGGPLALMVFSYQMLYTLFYGNITGVIIGGLALQYWALHRENWFWAGVGCILAVTKVQVGIPTSFAIWLLADCRWQTRLKMVIVPAVIGLASLALYPIWIIDILNDTDPPNQLGSISMWRYIGPLALALWLPTLLLPLTTSRRLLSVAITSALAAPYFQQNDLLAVFMYPVGWLALLGNLGFTFVASGYEDFWLITLAALLIYGWALGPGVIDLWRARRARAESPDLA